MFFGILMSDKKHSEQDELHPVISQDESILARADGVASIQNAAPQANAASTRLQPGDIIADWYKVVAFIGSGGMSNVYKCEDLSLNRIIAVKTLQSGGGSDSVRRFQTEGRAIAKLEHPNIVKLYGLVLTRESLPLLLMEFVSGVTLAKLLQNNKALPVQRALRIAGQIIEALEAAEKEGVIHRDLKPSNIMIVKPGSLDETVKILDFGIAKIQGESHLNVTRTGDVFGTPQYMSPEQAMGKKVDGRSDQYSFGCVLFEMLTGFPPYSAENSLAVMMAHVQSPRPSLTKAAAQAVPDHLETVMARLLQKNPDDRFDSMNDVGRAIFEANPKRNISIKSVIIGALVVLVIGCAAFLCLNYAVISKKVATPSTANGVPPSSESNNHTRHEKLYAGSQNLATQSVPTQSVLTRTAEPVKLGDSIQVRAIALSPDDKKLRSRLSKRATIQEVDLDGQQITDEGLKVVAQFEKLKRLNLRKCHSVTSKGIGYLTPLSLSLTALNLEDTGVDDHVGATLAQILSLEELDLSDTDIGNELCQQISHLPDLNRLNIKSTQIDGRALFYLKNIPTLRDLDLGRTQHIGNELEKLANLPLEILNLQSVGFTRHDFENSVLKMKSLKVLNLNETNIDDDELARLTILKGLKHLDIDNCKNLTLSGVQRFARLMPLCKLNQKQFDLKSTEPEDVLSKRTGPNLIRNGDFEKDGVLSQYKDLDAGAPGVSYWHITRGSVGLTGKYWRASHGVSSIELNGRNAGVLSQNFTTTPGQRYEVSFYATANPQTPPAIRPLLRVTIAGMSKVMPVSQTGSTPDFMNWKLYTILFTAHSPTSKLEFSSETAGDCGPCIDNVSVKSVLR